MTWDILFNLYEGQFHHSWSKDNNMAHIPQPHHHYHQIDARIKWDSHSPQNPTSPDSLKFKAHLVMLSQDPVTLLKSRPETGCGPSWDVTQIQGQTLPLGLGHMKPVKYNWDGPKPKRTLLILLMANDAFESWIKRTHTPDIRLAETFLGVW